MEALQSFWKQLIGESSVDILQSFWALGWEYHFLANQNHQMPQARDRWIGRGADGSGSLRTTNPWIHV